MSYASSTINTIEPSISWTKGSPADGASFAKVGTITNLASGTQVASSFNIAEGVWIVTATVAVTVNDATTAWLPSILGLYDSTNTLIGGTSICGEATYNDGTVIYQTLTLWVTSFATVQTNPFKIGFTPFFGGSTVAPTVLIDVDYIKIR
jgi:hypothetical protein